MAQFVAGVVVGMMFCIVALALYCCICLGAEKDRWMEAHLPHRKGESTYGTDIGSPPLCK